MMLRIADVFDEQDEAIWIDFMHVTPLGNQLVAERMIKLLAE